MHPTCLAIVSTLFAHETVHAIVANSSAGELIVEFTRTLKKNPTIKRNHLYPKDKVDSHPKRPKSLARLKEETYPFKLIEVDSRLVQVIFADMLRPFFSESPIWQKYWRIIEPRFNVIPPLARIKLQQARMFLHRPNLGFRDIMPFYHMYTAHPRRLQSQIQNAAPALFEAAAYTLRALQLYT